MTKMKIGFARSIMAVVALFAASTSLWADNGTWLYREGVGASVTAPADWADPDNWEGGIIATGKNSLATFAGTSALWVSIPDGYWIGSVRVNGNQNSTTFLGETINMSDNSQAWKSARFYGATSNVGLLQVWADKINVEGVFSPYAATICAPFDAGSVSLSFNAPFRRDWFATSSDENVSNIWNASEWSISGALQPIYTPSRKSASTGKWVLTEGKKLAQYVSGTMGLSLAPGQTAVADGILPAGTFVKRTYNDNYIELSNAALASSSGDGVELSFGAFSINQWQDVQSLKVQSGSSLGGLLLNRADANVSLVFKVAKITGDPTFYTNSGSTPGLLLLEDASGLGNAYQRGDSWVQFAGTDEICDMTLANLYFLPLPGSTKLGTFNVDVPSGRSLTVNSVALNSGVTCALSTATISKTGDGTLTVVNKGSDSPKIVCGGGELEYDASGLTLPSVTVNGGTFRPMPNSALQITALTVAAGGRISLAAGATLEPTTLTFAAGGIIRVEEGVTFDASGWNLPDGTVFEGPGAVTGLTSAKIKACEFHGGVSIAVTGSADNLMMTDTTSTNLPTRVSPAFWVSAKAEDSLIYGEAGKPNLITQWNDCRGTPEQGYHFATNAMPGGFKIDDTRYAPYLAGSNSGTGGPLVWMRKTATTVSSPGNSPALVWDTPITGIKAVFAVVAGQYDSHNGGGSLLGSTERLSTCDFLRPNGNTWCNDRFSSSHPNLWNAPYYINGHLPPDGQTLAGYIRTKPMLNGCFTQVVDVHPLGEGAEADCWGYQNAAPAVCGAWIGECIIYTNAVTDVERRRIENYLMAKWFGSRVVAAEIVPPEQEFFGDAVGGANLNVAAGDAVSIQSLTNANGLVKSGAGAVYLKGVQTTGALSVQGGVVNIQSHDVTTNFVLPEGALIHVDANDDDSFPGATATDGGQSVPKWIDTDNPDNPIYLENNWGIPTRRTDSTSFVREMSVVDYGAFHNKLDSDWTVSKSWYPADGDSRRIMHQLKSDGVRKSARISAVFAVWGTAAGGNQLLGGVQDGGYGLTRDYVASDDVAGNIAKPILTDGDNHRTSYNSAISFNSLALKNGNEVILTETPPSGTYDIVSILSSYDVEWSTLGFYKTGEKAGGLQMGELICYSNPLTTDEARRIDAYLNYKWFGREPDVWNRPAHVGVLDVAAGATVNVVGDAPIVCSALSGAGTVNGDVRIGGDTVFEVFVNSDGSISPGPAVSGAVDMSHGGVVRLTGYVSALAVGDYQLIASSSVNFGEEWTIEGYEGRKKIVLRKRSDGLWLSLVNDAFVIIIR